MEAEQGDEQQHIQPAPRLHQAPEGTNRQPQGTITTSPKEINGIIKEVYGKIYRGNVVNKQANADKYFGEYGPKGSNLIYQAEEAPIDGITAEDVEQTCRDTKEAAAGLDQ